MNAAKSGLPPPFLRCDVAGCRDEIAVKLDGEQRCFRHAMERGNEIRAAGGLPPIVLDDDGAVHIVH